MKFPKNTVLILSIVTSQSLSAAVTHSIGIARDANNNVIRYVEHHQYLASGDHLVKYFDPTGDIIATKTMSYPGLPQHPEIVQSDFTRDMDVETYNTDQTLEMIRNVSGLVETFNFPLDETTIVDAGFDYFLRNNWQTFEEGVPQVYKLAVAGQERLLTVQITKQPSSDTNTAFTIKPRNFFVGLLVPEIRLRYDRDRRLLAYEGLTNLNLPSGRKNVSIEFNHYSSPNKLARPLSQWVPDQ